MSIKVGIKPPAQMQPVFRDLKRGDTFWSADDHLCMVIGTLIDVGHKAVVLDSGVVWNPPFEEPVRLVNIGVTEV